MIECLCLTRNGYQRRFAYNWNETDKIHFTSKAIKTKRSTTYIRRPATFDIERSTYYKDFDGEQIPRGVCYHLQMCVEGRVIFRRTWGEWIVILSELRKRYKLDVNKKLVIYVHNLSYEFQFIYQFFNKINECFCTAEHKILKVTFDDVFEFRCSYYLTNMSLAKMIENVPQTEHLKGAGDLDYDKFRLPSTPLTEIERGYCYNDVRGLYERLVYGYLKNDNLFTIPLTSTGYVRRDCRKAMKENDENRDIFLKSKLDIELYNLCKECFRGGNTASNRYLTNVILYDVHSFDMASAYPFQMISKKYPVGQFMKCTPKNEQELNEFNKEFCTIGRYTFIDIECKQNVPVPYIPFDKCQQIGASPLIYNGRILKSRYITMSLTNIDYEIIKNQYNIKEIAINDFYIARKEFLPAELRAETFKYFKIKSTLKGVAGKEYEYTKGKNKLNSLYGMCVTDILHPNFEFNKETGEFLEIPNTDIDKYYNSRNSFLSYQWGIFVSAYTRQMLQNAIDKIGLDVVYCDTDSVKYIGEHSAVFAEINNEINEYCKANNIQNYVEFDGKRYEMGVFEHDAEYKEFITLGAKKYAYKDMNDKIHITVSGLDKKQGAQELEQMGGLPAFKDGQIFHNSGRSSVYYNVADVHVETINGEKVLTASNIRIVPTTYTLGITDTMKSILQSVERW